VSNCPIESIVRSALEREGLAFTEDGKPGGDVNCNLDFHLTDYGIHVEVKQFHSDRIAEHMARATNVIAIQGKEAAEFFAAILVDYQRTGETK
jgi:hypothetical protein